MYYIFCIFSCIFLSDLEIERYDFFFDHNVIAGSVSQNCGRQPHIVSTNHSNLIAVGPNRSLASRQAIVWTYRPRVEATESQSPDFLRSESYTDGKSSERVFLQDFQSPVLELKQQVGRKAQEQKNRVQIKTSFIFFTSFYFMYFFLTNFTVFRFNIIRNYYSIKI